MNKKRGFDEALIPDKLDLMEIAHVIPVKISLVDLQGRFVYLNDVYVNWLGLPREDLLGKEVNTILHSVEEDDCAIIRSVYEGGGRKTCDVELRHPDGTIRMVHLEMVPNPGNQTVFSFLRDVTAEKAVEASEARYKALLGTSKRYEQSILAERARLEAVFDTAVDAILVIDEVGTIQSINRAGIDAFGYDESDLIGKNIKMLMPESYASQHDSYLRRYRETGQRHIIGKGVEGEGLRRDGSVFPCELAVAEFIAEGKRFFTGIIRDISERKNHMRAMQEWNQNLERELQKRGRALDQIFNLSGDVLALMSYDGHFVSVSPSAERMTGIPTETAIREKIHFSRFAVEEDRAGLKAVIKHVIDSGQPVHSYEFRVMNVIEGSPRWTAWSAKPVPEDRLIIVVGRDVTLEKQREEGLRQSQKMEAIGQLTGGIAHDFNNILMGIMGSLDLIQSKLPDDSVTKYVDAAIGSAKKAASLTQRLLAFSRRQPLAPISVATNDLIQSMEEMLSRSIGPSVDLTFELDPDAEPIFCDPNQLENALLNLVINSRDAIPESGAIVIRTKKVTWQIADAMGLPNTDFVEVSCTDNGVGMDESTRERVFDPFFTTKPIGKGTGLGLSMLYGFVNQSGGHVRLDTSPGVGTTVSMYLPRSEQTPLAITEQTATVGRMMKPLDRQRRVLLIEDEDVIRNLVQDVLESSGFEVAAVAEGNAALAEISDLSKQIDLVVSDVGLPGLNGKQIAEMGRVVRPDLRTLFITGYAAGVTLRNDWLADGMDMILKPFKMETLIAKVEEMIADTEDAEANG